ncbi:MAG: ABC transporter ATP-binding protein, partial [Candidatus Heimdallarchaeota archaeon]|nr:ABC transporter ATP-binding protein [Candidatus Heimdallarchaeota archaeon]
NYYIELEQVSKNFRDPASDVYFPALRTLDLKVKKGSLTTIIGPSGAGKSTLLNIVGGLVKPSTGSIKISGVTLHRLNNKSLSYFRRNYLGFLWQIPERNLLPKLTCLQNIYHAMEIVGYPQNKRKSRAEQLLKDVGLEKRANHAFHQLSGGEAARAGLAVALANEPELLLADEPTGELDSKTTMQIIKFLRELNDKYQTTMLIVTHDTRFAGLSDQTYEILDGGLSNYKENIYSPVKIAEPIKNEVNTVEYALVDKYGMVKIPDSIRAKHNITEKVQFTSNCQCNGVCIIPKGEI